MFDQKIFQKTKANPNISKNIHVCMNKNIRKHKYYPSKIIKNNYSITELNKHGIGA